MNRWLLGLAVAAGALLLVTATAETASAYHGWRGGWGHYRHGWGGGYRFYAGYRGFYGGYRSFYGYRGWGGYRPYWNYGYAYRPYFHHYRPYFGYGYAYRPYGYGFGGYYCGIDYDQEEGEALYTNLVETGDDLPMVFANDFGGEPVRPVASGATVLPTSSMLVREFPTAEAAERDISASANAGIPTLNPAARVPPTTAPSIRPRGVEF